MCGLLTVIGHNLEDSQFESSLKTLTHRGPDEFGVYKEGLVQMGHTRLSIIDLESGTQPLMNEDHSLVLTCNGEIYDFERIREDLIARGHHFSTKSDSEIILHLYEEYGEDMYQHLRGEFAFILWDKKKNTIIACKDRFGIKPLFMARTDQGYIFASEVKAIFATGLVTPKIDIVSVRNVISFYSKGVIFENIDPVPPAASIHIDLATQNKVEKKYWNLKLPNYTELKSEKSKEQLQKETLDLIEQSIKIRLRADVPVGVYLSGGIDSSMIIGTVAKFGKKDLKAFSISFTEDETFNESTLAKKMADHAGAEYFQVNANKSSLLENFEQMLWHTELPTHNLHGVGKFLLSKLAREHVTVCLTGEGADEVFLGYDYFKIDEYGAPKAFGNISGKVFKEKKKKNNKILDRLNRVKQMIGIQPPTELAMNYANIDYIESFFAKTHRKTFEENDVMAKIRREIDREETDNRDPVAQLQYFSIRKMMAPYILTMLADRQEMAHSIEGRTPFLDHHLFEYARSIPLDLKIKDNFDEKHILKEISKDRVIEEIFQRHKWPYFAPSIPVKKRDHHKMDELIDKYLSKSAINDAGLFDFRAIRKLMFLSKPIGFFFPKTQSRLNGLLTTILSVQILYFQFCAPNYFETDK